MLYGRSLENPMLPASKSPLQIMLPGGLALPGVEHDAAWPGHCGQSCALAVPPVQKYPVGHRTPLLLVLAGGQ